MPTALTASLSREPFVANIAASTLLIRLNYAARWTLLVYSPSKNALKTITAIRWRRYPIAGGDCGGWQNADPTLLPIAAGGSYMLEPSTPDSTEELELELTASANDTDVSLTLTGL